MAEASENALPQLVAQQSPAEVVDVLDQAAKRGRLAGFERTETTSLGGEGVLFRTCAFSSPFEGELVAKVAPAASTGEGTHLTFEARLKRKLPVIFWVITLVSIWPGYPFTRDLLMTVLPGAKWLWGTAAYWYLPLAVIGGPWSMWVAIKRSKNELRVSAVEMVGKIKKELGAKPLGG